MRKIIKIKKGESTKNPKKREKKMEKLENENG